MNREVHVRFWERPEVKVLRATRHSRRFDRVQRAHGIEAKALQRSLPDEALSIQRAGLVEISTSRSLCRTDATPP